MMRLLTSARRKTETARGAFRVPTSIRLIGGLAVSVLVGTLLLLIPAVSAPGKSMTFSEALFTAVSALSVTGLSVITPSTDLSQFGKIVLMCLIQVGGIGYMVLAVLVFRIMGRNVSLTDRMALQDALGLINRAGIVELTRRVFLTVLAIEAIGAILLFLHWRTIMPPHLAVFHSIFHSVSAFCNAGFELFSGRREFPIDPYSLGILGTLIVLGGLGIPVLYDLVTYWKVRKLSLHTRLTLRVAAGLLIWGAIGIFISEVRPGGVLHELPLWRQVEFSAFQSISSRTAGFAALPNFGSIDAASEMMIMTLMFIGCAPASMGGGVTTGTFIILVLAMISYVKREETPIVWGKAIPGEMVRKAAAVLTISLAAVLTSSWLLMLTQGSEMDESLFEVVSAFATCGLSLGLTTELDAAGQAIIIFMMFWGRLGALTLLFAFTRPSAKRRVNYPEEKVLIG